MSDSNGDEEATSYPLTEEDAPAVAYLASVANSIIENAPEIGKLGNDAYQVKLYLTLPFDMLADLKNEYRKGDGQDPCCGELNEFCCYWEYMLGTITELADSRTKLSTEDKQKPDALVHERANFKGAITDVLGKMESKARGNALRRCISAYANAFLPQPQA